MAAHLADLAAPRQLCRNGDRIRGLALPVQVEDRVVDQLVARAVEVATLDGLHDVGDGVLAHHHRAEHGLFGGDVLRRRAVRLREVAHLSQGHAVLPFRTAGTYLYVTLDISTDSSRSSPPRGLRPRPQRTDVRGDTPKDSGQVIHTPCARSGDGSGAPA